MLNCSKKQHDERGLNKGTDADQRQTASSVKDESRPGIELQGIASQMQLN